MILYHGSNTEIQKIDLSKSKPNKDFGKAFYLSEEKQQAEEMAAFTVDRFDGTPIITSFEFDETLLDDRQLQVKTFEGYSREWAEFIFSNRDSDSEVNIHNYDIVYGLLPMTELADKCSTFVKVTLTLRSLCVDCIT